MIHYFCVFYDKNYIEDKINLLCSKKKDILLNFESVEHSKQRM